MCNKELEFIRRAQYILNGVNNNSTQNLNLPPLIAGLSMGITLSPPFS